jgi:hypothetical protein
MSPKIAENAFVAPSATLIGLLKFILRVVLKLILPSAQAMSKCGISHPFGITVSFEVDADYFLG